MAKKLLLCFLFLVSCQHKPTASNATVPHSAKERADHSTAEAFGTEFAIATQGRYASKAAEDIFAAGGNIIDAAVAASFVISVERPQSTGIGGGGFFLYHESKSGKTYAVDFRERAPLKAARDMYVHDGKADTRLSQNGATAVATPGLVAGLLEIHQRFGRLTRAQVLAPAIRLAREGFPIYAELARALEERSERLSGDPEARAIFLKSDRLPPKEGELLIQKDLAKTLEKIAKLGAAGFYKGDVGKSIVRFVQKNGGTLAQKDLDTYQVKWREPLRGNYAGYEVYSMPPPSSGGVHVLQFLEFLQGDRLREKGFLSAEAIHLEASALQSAFADRAQYLGDPDFIKVPVQGLLSAKYLAARRAEVPTDRARHIEEVAPGKPAFDEPPETTHLSLIDKEGNAVSSTQTVNGWMGAAVVAPGTGVILNNEMDDFSIKAGVANMFGAVGAEANSIAPKKTPLSSMSPTLLVKDGQVRMAVGAPGGTRIISCTAQTILNYVEFGLPLYEAVAAVRYHHQWKPDVLILEPPGPGEKVVQKLQKMGYQVELKPVGCNVMAVTREGDRLHGVADPRDIGTSLAR